MKKILKMTSVPLLVFLFVGLSVTPVLASVKEHTLSWSPGYDNSSVTVSPASKLVYSVNGSQLTMQYALNGASIRNTAVEFFLFIFWRSTSDCIPPTSFGNVTHVGLAGTFACGDLTKQGVTRLITSFPLGIITLDSTGSGSLNVNISGIPRGNYQAEFIVLEGFISPVFGVCIPISQCAVVLQSPGPTFGETAPIRVHGNTGAFG